MLRNRLLTTTACRSPDEGEEAGVTVHVATPEVPQGNGETALEVEALRSAVRAEVIAERAEETAVEAREATERTEDQWQQMMTRLEQQSSDMASLREQLSEMSQQIELNTSLNTAVESTFQTTQPELETLEEATSEPISTDPLTLTTDLSETPTEVTDLQRTDNADESEGESLAGVVITNEAPRRRVLMY